MSYLEIYAAANDAAFQSRCQVAMWRAAQDITNEPAETEGHALRLDWAERVLREEVKITGRQLALQVLRNGVIAAGPASAADGDIQFQVNSVLNSIIAIG